MPTLADPPIASAQPATRRVPCTRPERATPPSVSRFIDGVDAFADRMLTLLIAIGTAQAFE